MKKNLIFTLILVIFCVLVLGLSLRGLSGNPTAKELNTDTWKENGPLELSPDRGRYALAYSLAEDVSTHFSLDVARLATPDLGISPNGNFVSLFAPTVSYIVLPGYIVGKVFNLAQVGMFSIISIFGILNFLLIIWISNKLGANKIASVLGAFAFLFASPALAYAVSLYQHHITVFLILSSVAALMKWEGLKPLWYVWFMCALSISVDNPNLFFMLPIGVYALGRLISIDKKEDGSISPRINYKGIITLSAMILPIVFFLWFNWSANGSPLQLSGTLPAVKNIDESGKPFNGDHEIEIIDGKVKLQEGKTAVSSFDTRNLLEGFYVHSFSPDRGVVWFAPVLLFGFLGLWMLYTKDRTSANLLGAIMGANILLYSMWGDPWGGWAFGSRYLIPSYAILSIGISIFLSRWRNNYIILALFSLVFAYSAWVNTLGAITSSTNPPQAEILGLEAQTGKIEKYTYERNLDYLKSNRSKAFIFKEYSHKIMTAEQYHSIILSLIYSGFMSLMCVFVFHDWFIKSINIGEKINE